MTRLARTNWNTVGLLALSIAIMIVGGCRDSASTDAQAHDHDQAHGDHDTASTSADTDSVLPEGFFLATTPDGATSLLEAKTSASVGDQVVFEARIGGRTEPFMEGTAVFLVADSTIPTCAELHGDSCPTPWDYCCEPKENLLKHMATVQLVDMNGRPLRGSVKGISGLDMMKRIVVVGTVSQSDGPTFVVNASGIFVETG